MPPITRLQRLLQDRPDALSCVAGVALCVLVPTALRWALQSVLGQTIWFATYYPAVLAATLLLGWRLGLLTLLLSALVADYMFIPPVGAPSLGPADVAALLVFLFSGGIILITAALLREALQRITRSMAIQDELNGELQHRVNNNLAVVQSLAAQTLRSSPEPKVFYANFQARLVALSKAQAVLSSGDWQRCGFPELPNAALEPFSGSGALRLEGPNCSAPAVSCVPLVLALHELATNATKHGALSAPEGRVLLSWRLAEGRQGPDLILEWVESGGPAVKPPSRKGLGTRLLAPQPGLSEVRVDYNPAGLQCRMVVQGVSVPAPAARGAAPSPAAGLNADPTPVVPGG